MANWSNPTLTSLYTDFLNDLKARDTDLALQFDGVTATNLATGTIRWSSTANRWQKWNGTAWAELTTIYALTGLSTTGNASIGGTLAVTGATTLAAATATTPATNDNSTAVATTAYVRAQGYATLASPALTGTPTAPTAAADTNTTQLATTAYVLGQASSTTPAMNGTGAVGTASRWARADHVHPTDTSRAPLASPTFTGTPAAPTAAVGTNTTQLATCAYVNAEIANDAPLKDGTGATGTWSISISGNAGTATTLATARTINGVSFNGSANITVTAATPQALTAGSFITSTGTFDGSTARTFAVDATSANTASKVVARDASGNFSAGTITASLTGTASGNLALTGGTLSGALQTTAGSAAAPGIGIGEANTGLFRPSTGVLALATGGSEVLRLTAANGIGLGSTGTNVNVGFRHAKSITGGTTAWAQLVDGAVQTDVTSVAAGIASAIGTAASTTLTSLVHFQASTGTLGVGTTLTNQIGFSATSTLDGATNDFGFYGNIGAGTGNWNCYMVGAAPNFFSGQVQLGAGSVGTPSLSTNSDTNTGIYFPAADTIGFAEGGTESMRIDSAGRLIIGATQGRATPSSLSAFARLQLEGGDNNDSAFSITNTTNGAAGRAANIRTARIRGTGIVADGDITGQWSFWGYDGSDFIQNAAIEARVDGTPALTSVPGRLSFYTATNASPSVVTERLTITSTGQVRLAGAGITFNGDTATVNELDDYEEGTFTPTIVGTGTAGTGTYSVQVGRYTKIGHRVYFQINLTWSAHTGTTSMIVGALPFTSANVANAVSAVSVRHSNLTSPASTIVQGFVASNATTITLESVAVAGGAATALAMDTAATLTVSGHYQAA